MSFRMGGGNEPLAPVFKEVMAEAVIRQSRQLLASEAFRKKATPDEIREIERTLLEAEATLARYDQQRKARGAPLMGGVGMTGTLDPVAAIGALVIVAIGVAFLSQSPGAKQAGEALDEALERVKDRISQIAGRSGAAAAGAAAAVATATVIQATSLDTLGKILGKSPGEFKRMSKATLDAIRLGIAALFVGTVPPRCKDKYDNYQTQLKRANNAVTSGGNSSQARGLEAWDTFVERGAEAGPVPHRGWRAARRAGARLRSPWAASRCEPARDAVAAGGGPLGAGRPTNKAMQRPRLAAGRRPGPSGGSGQTQGRRDALDQPSTRIRSSIMAKKMTPLEFANLYYNLFVYIYPQEVGGNGKAGYVPPTGWQSLRADNYRLGGSSWQHTFWSHDIQSHFKRPVEVTVMPLSGMPEILELNSEQALRHFNPPFSGKGSPEQAQIAIQLVYRFRKVAMPLNQFVSVDFVGLDCNGFVGNYYRRVVMGQDWKNLDVNKDPGPTTLMDDLLALGTEVVDPKDLRDDGTYVLVWCDDQGNIKNPQKGVANTYGHVMITEPDTLYGPPGNQTIHVVEATAAGARKLRDIDYTIKSIEVGHGRSASRQRSSPSSAARLAT